METAVRPSRQESDPHSNTQRHSDEGGGGNRGSGICTDATSSLSSTDECSLSVSLSLKCDGTRPETVILLLLHFAPSLCLELDEEEIAPGGEAWVSN